MVELSGFQKNNKGYSGLKSLTNFEPYSLHKIAKHRFVRRQTIANAIDEFWQVDLIDVKDLKQFNSNYQYLLTCICVLSKYAWVTPLKNKTAEGCAVAFEDIFAKEPVPQFIYSDWGYEFKSRCKKVFAIQNIVHIDCKSKHKASIVERFNRTLKEKMWRFFTHSKTRRYIDVLQDMVEAYNNSFHRSIGRAPTSVDQSNVSVVKNKLFGVNYLTSGVIESDYSVKFVFNIGDYVRGVVDKKKFEKGYTPNWSKGVYIISMLNPSNPATYKIKNLDGREIDWLYYKEELQKIDYQFDSFEVLQQKKDAILVKKLNSENQAEKWVQRVQPTRMVKKSIANT